MKEKEVEFGLIRATIADAILGIRSRLWRTMKYEKVYLNPSSNGTELYHKLDENLKYYNEDSRHSMIGEKRPIDLFSEPFKVAA